MKNKISHKLDIRITYADTDRMGVVYYANYLVFFEKGRTELMRSLGMRYKDLEEQEKVFLPCSHVDCKYFASAKYDDLVRVKTTIKECKGAHIDFDYEVTDADSGQLLAKGFTKHPFVNDEWRPVRPPKTLWEKIKV